MGTTLPRRIDSRALLVADDRLSCKHEGPGVAVEVETASTQVALSDATSCEQRRGLFRSWRRER